MCKGDEHQQVTIDKEEKCPVHKMEEEQSMKVGKYKGMKIEEWPATNCEPM